MSVCENNMSVCENNMSVCIRVTYLPHSSWDNRSTGLEVYVCHVLWGSMISILGILLYEENTHLTLSRIIWMFTIDTVTNFCVHKQLALFPYYICIPYSMNMLHMDYACLDLLAWLVTEGVV
ncbi:hypothetical protein BDB01DRAFT_835238 [Pilobolus umbonatus]|nr:hypothetical protein BDB01DRAFT_835238 [Pilobolus umbonatus]